MKNNQKGFSFVVIISIIFVFGIVGFSGWYIWQNQKPDTAKRKSNITTSGTDMNSLTIYKDTELGFYFDYPNSWELAVYSTKTSISFVAPNQFSVDLKSSSKRNELMDSPIANVVDFYLSGENVVIKWADGTSDLFKDDQIIYNGTTGIIVTGNSFGAYLVGMKHVDYIKGYDVVLFSNLLESKNNEDVKPRLLQLMQDFQKI